MTDRQMPEGFRPHDPTAAEQTDGGVYFEVEFRTTEHPPQERGADAEPWIIVEPQFGGTPPPEIGNAFFGLEFREGVTLRQAEELANQLRNLVVGMTATRFRT